MNPRHIAHVIAGLVLAGRFGDVFVSLLFIADDFKIQTEIQMSVEHLSIERPNGSVVVVATRPSGLVVVVVNDAAS